MRIRVDCLFSVDNIYLHELELIYLKEKFFQKDTKRSGKTFEWYCKDIPELNSLINDKNSEEDNVKAIREDIIENYENAKIIVNNESYKIFSEVGYDEVRNNFYYTLTPEFRILFKIIRVHAEIPVKTGNLME